MSKDIRNPEYLTVVTYQALHAAFNNLANDNEEDIDDENSIDVSGNDNSNEIVKGLREKNVETIILDEAHHLKNEWWQTLTKIKNELNPTIVGLTATPPYDVTPLEWQRYVEMNGSVDTEISVPELVIEGDLCPHQDYVLCTFPVVTENQAIVNFRNDVEKAFQEIKNDELLVKAIENTPIWIDPVGNLDWIYNNLSYYSASLIFLNENRREISYLHLEIVEDGKLEIPKLNYEWLEILLDFFIFNGSHFFGQYEEHQKRLENKLKRIGTLERKTISFTHNKRITGLLTSSISKLNGIKEIAEFEYEKLASSLRLVILSDYIRQEFMPNTPENNLILNKIGVIPIFEKLRRENSQKKKIAVLTGSVIIIPRLAYPAFQKEASKFGLGEIQFLDIPYDKEYILICQSEQRKGDIVHIITKIFQEGEIEILIGTKSLLGEGWDAPAINSLILASFVGSFVLSNQMRGRAIRTERGNLDKTSNIWHLVCIDPTDVSGGEDFDLLKRRFRSFVGVSFKEEAGIENGIGRLNLPEAIHLKEEVEAKNSETFAYAGDRETLKQRWETALATGVSLVEEIKIPFPEDKSYRKVKSMYFTKTIGNLITTLGFGLLAYLDSILKAFGRSVKSIRTVQDLYVFLAMVAGLGILLFGRLTFKTLKLYIQYRDISKDIQQIGEALLNGLVKAGVIHTSIHQLRVEASVDFFGSVYCHLEGGTTFEKSVFINSLQEVIGLIDNPRYIIIRKNRFMLFLKQKDYHTVPDVLGRKKDFAEYFRAEWEKHVGPCDLIFTRTIEGRKMLLKSRVKSLSSQIEKKVEHVNKWR